MKKILTGKILMKKTKVKNKCLFWKTKKNKEKREKEEKKQKRMKKKAGTKEEKANKKHTSFWFDTKTI